jgi:uncharacterized protein (TIGR02145 family)
MACKYYDITISEIDIADATGNTFFPDLNGKVFVKYTDCDGTEQEVGYDTPGTYVDEFCANNNEYVLLGFYSDNQPFAITRNSTYSEQSDCSSEICPGNLITNPNFDNNLDGWDVTPFSYVWSWSSNLGGSALFTGSNDEPGVLSQNILTVGETYDISFDVRYDQISPNGQIMSVFAGDTEVIVTPSVGLSTINLTMVCTSNTTFSIYVIFFNTPEIYVTNVCITQQPTPTTLCFEYIGVGPNILYQCSVQSEPTFYNGRNYWVLNGCPTDSWNNYPECPIIDNNNYIWWNGSSWVHSDTLGGGFVFTTLANPGLSPIQILGTYEWTSALINYSTCAPQMLNSFSGPCVPLSTPTPTPTPTNTQTPTKTPTQTPTQTQTPTNTVTSSQTPSTTPISCGLGLIKTNSEYYYTDCCGNFISGFNNTGDGLQVSFNYNLPRGGVGKLNVPATISCPSPTPTPTQTVTPSNTATPTVTPTNTVTPTQSVTPSITPSNTPVTRLQNSCDVITLFDLGVSCNVIQSPTESNPLGGILSVNVTGGTSPYSFSWVGTNQRSQTLNGVPAGTYQVIVTDYAWPDGQPDGVSDYTATTICELVGPVPTSTPTMTPTPTQTTPVQCVDLCLIAIGGKGVPNDGPYQFTCNGTQNGRFRWTSGRTDIVWNPINNRWEIYIAGTTTPFTLGGGIVASTTFDLIPDSAWAVFGGDLSYTLTMTRGYCPTAIPLQVSVDETNSSCQGTTNCNGSLTILAENGYPPYLYSIDGGTTYSSDYTFTNLCPNTYSVVVRDSFNNTQNSSVSVGFDSSPTTYQLSLTNVGTATPITVPNVSQTITQVMELVVTPPLPVGVSVTFNLKSSAERTINSPGVANSTINWTVTKNGQSVNTVISPTTISSQGTRPFCSVNDTQLINLTEYSSLITITNGDVVNITSTTVDTITNGQVSSQTNCTTNIKTVIRAVIERAEATGNNCSAAIGSSRQVQTNELTYVPVTITNPCTNCVSQDITIGTQIWSKCNLDVTTYSDGTPIPQVTDPTAWVGLTTGAWCYYDNNSVTGVTYGKLYNWFAVAGIWNEASKTDVNQRKKLAPNGYHIPSDTEWTVLTDYLGGESVAGGKMKEPEFCHWNTPNIDATNITNFSGFAGGGRGTDGIFGGIRDFGIWWSSTEGALNAYYRFMTTNSDDCLRSFRFKNSGYSVRLIKDPPLPEVLEHNSYGSGVNPLVPTLCAPSALIYGKLYSYASQGTSPAVGITLYYDRLPNNVLSQPLNPVNGITNVMGWNGGQKYRFTVSGAPGVITTINPCT